MTGRACIPRASGHGDALHMSDLDPDRPGLEVFQPHESPSSYGANGLEFRDARTGALIFGVQATGDIGRGLALDVDPRYPRLRDVGLRRRPAACTPRSSSRRTPCSARAACRSRRGSRRSISASGGMAICCANCSTARRSANGIGTPAPPRTSCRRPGIASNNGTKATPGLSADILGDWREEVIWRESDNTALRIYVTTIPTHASVLYADARSAVSGGDRVAERRLQSAAASGLLPWRRHVPAARPQHRHLARRAARAARAGVRGDRQRHGRFGLRLRHERHDAGDQRHGAAWHDRHVDALRRRRNRKHHDERKRRVELRLHRHAAARRRGDVQRHGDGYRSAAAPARRRRHSRSASMRVRPRRQSSRASRPKRRSSSAARRKRAAP